MGGGLLSRDNFVYEVKPLWVKLNDRKVRWLIQEKRKGRGSGELALMQKISRRRVEQLWQAYRLTGAILTLQKPGLGHSQSNLFSEASEALREMRQRAIALRPNTFQSCCSCETGIGESVMKSRRGWMVQCAGNCRCTELDPCAWGIAINMVLIGMVMEWSNSVMRIMCYF